MIQDIFDLPFSSENSRGPAKPSAGSPPPPSIQPKTKGPEDDRPSEILFLGLLLDPALFSTTTSRIRATCKKYEFTGRPIAAERLHISLLGFGAYSAELATAVSQVASTIKHPPIDITLDTALSFQVKKPKRPFVLTSDHGVDQVRAFYREVRAAFPGLKTDASITPHMTLIWDQKIIPAAPTKLPLSWTAREFVLVRSFQGQSRYEIVGRWPFTVPNNPVQSSSL